MLFELFKNAMRAVVEHHGPAADNFPPVEVLLVMGQEDLTIKVCCLLSYASLFNEEDKYVFCTVQYCLL